MFILPTVPQRQEVRTFLVPCLQVMFLKGLRYIYQFNIFLYMMMSIMGISILFMAIKGPGKWKRKKREDAYTY
jgi:hypothetical protein